MIGKEILSFQRPATAAFGGRAVIGHLLRASNAVSNKRIIQFAFTLNNICPAKETSCQCQKWPSPDISLWPGPGFDRGY